MKKQKRLNLSILLIILPIACAFAQKDSLPIDLTRFYFMGELKNYKSFIVGDKVDQDYNIKKISKNAQISYEILSETADDAVIAVSIEEKNQNTDLYAFWTHINGWKLQSIRTLRLPGIFCVMLEKCKNLNEAELKLQYDNIISEPRNSDSSMTEEEVHESPGTFEEFSLNIKILKLAASSDKDLINHFNQNKEKFNALLLNVLKEHPNGPKGWKIDNNSPYKTSMDEIFVSSVSNFENPKIISFIVAKMMDNYVGYFYCKNAEDLPSMEDNNYIMIRSLGNGWYLYKTT